MTSKERKEWKDIIYVSIMYLFLPYFKELLILLNFDSVTIDNLSKAILYGGIVFLLIILYLMNNIKKKYNTPYKEIVSDEKLARPYRLMIILGLGILAMEVIKKIF